jgi:predicted TIM-barrel fold metal-dependent hydrolase
MSPRLLKSFAFRFLRWKFGLTGEDERTERGLEEVLTRTIDRTEQLDAAVVLAFDAVYTPDGRRDDPNTHFYVTNDYVMELRARHPRMLFGASVHPYRADAIAELERCVRGGAVLMKWLPITQGMNPADPRCFEFYDALAHHKLPLLCHTGGEQSLPRIDNALAACELLETALRRGVTVIMAHCGTRSLPLEPDYLDQFIGLARRYEHCYGDTSALNLPTRAYAWPRLLRDRDVRAKLIHGSDWPIIAMPPVMELGVRGSVTMMREPNWMRRDVLIKQKLGLDEQYWHRAARILRGVGVSPTHKPL